MDWYDTNHGTYVSYIHDWAEVYNRNMELIAESTYAPTYRGQLSWISNYVPGKVWGEITYPFLNFNGTTVEVYEWISNFIPHISGQVTLIHARIKVKPC